MATEQELRDQVTEGRAALGRIRSSARIATWVRFLAVLAGIAFVALFLWHSYENRIKPLQQADVWTPVVEMQTSVIMNSMALDRKIPELLPEVAKAYYSEAVALVEESRIQESVQSELEAFIQDVNPIAERELNRIQPQIVNILERQQEELLSDIEEMLDTRVNQQLAQILMAQQEKLGTTLDINDQKLEQIIDNLREAGEHAAQKVVEARIEKNREHIDAIIMALAEIPDLPRQDEITNQELIDELVRALLARVKLEIPDYEFE